MQDNDSCPDCGQPVLFLSAGDQCPRCKAATAAAPKPAKPKDLRLALFPVPDRLGTTDLNDALVEESA